MTLCVPIRRDGILPSHDVLIDSSTCKFPQDDQSWKGFTIVHHRAKNVCCCGNNAISRDILETCSRGAKARLSDVAARRIG